MSRFLFFLVVLMVVGAFIFYQQRQTAISPKLHEPVSSKTLVRSEPLISKAQTAAEFHLFTQATLKSLPTIRDLQQLKGEEIHNTPKAIFSAGKALGDIAQAVEEHGEFAPEAFQFYENCSREIQLPPAIRALCFSHYLEFGERLQQKTDLMAVPQEVRDLAAKLKI